jgi:ribosomal protein S9
MPGQTGHTGHTGSTAVPGSYEYRLLTDVDRAIISRAALQANERAHYQVQLQLKISGVVGDAAAQAQAVDQAAKLGAAHDALLLEIDSLPEPPASTDPRSRESREARRNGLRASRQRPTAPGPPSPPGLP